jgi:hypothetical protein
MLKIDNKVNRKIVAHSLKYPTQNTFGYLIGESKNQVVEIKDAIPLSHNPINSCLLHISLDLLKGQNIIGFYDVVENSEKDQETLQMQKKVLKCIQKVFGIGESFFIRLKFKKNSDVNYDNLSYKESLQQFEKEEFAVDFEYWRIKDNLNLVQKEDLNVTENESSYEKDFRENKHTKLVDIDEHLDNPEKCFLNKDF